MMVRRVLSCLLIAATAWAAQAGLVLGPQYRFEAGATARTHIAAQIDGVQMGSGVPLAVTGNAEVDVTLTVREIGEDGVATIVASFGAVTAELMGQAQNSPAPAPLELRVDQRGRLVGAAGGEGLEMNLFAGGGIPVQLVVLLAAVAEFPEEPVAPGEVWSTRLQHEVAEVGTVAITSSSRLLTVDETGAALTTDVRASFPDFTTPNPLQGGEITVRNAVLTVEGMERTVDASTGLTCSARATMHIDCLASLGGFTELPLTVVSSFTMTALPAAVGQAPAPRTLAPRLVGTAPAPVAYAPAPPPHPAASAAAWLARTVGAWAGNALSTIGKRMGWL